MTPELEELGRRAAACAKWRWLPGMLTDTGVRLGARNGEVTIVAPDLSDPATVGCLLALVREAWPCAGSAVSPMQYMNRWFVDLPGNESAEECSIISSSEVEALVLALEKTP